MHLQPSLVLVAALLPLLVAGTGPRSVANTTLAYLLSKISSSAPLDADPAFDCKWREFALQYAAQIQPWISTAQQQELFDALQLASLCKQTFYPSERVQPEYASQWLPTLLQPAATAAINVFVSPSGSDAADGSLARPKKTLDAAVQRVRELRGGSTTTSAAIFLRAGVYYLNTTVTLDSLDSRLSIAAYPGEQATLSGGRLLQGLQWRPTANPAVYQAAITPAMAGDLPNGMAALRVNGLRATLARYPNANAEIDLFPTGYVLSGGETWLPPASAGRSATPTSSAG